MDLCYGVVRAALPTIFTLVVSVGTVLSEVLLQILLHNFAIFFIVTAVWAWSESEPACDEVIC